MVSISREEKLFSEHPMIEVRKLLLIAGMMASTVGATASVSAKGRSVERAQQILTLSGFDPGPVDGLWG